MLAPSVALLPRLGRRQSRRRQRKLPHSMPSGQKRGSHQVPSLGREPGQESASQLGSLPVPQPKDSSLVEPDAVLRLVALQMEPLVQTVVRLVPLEVVLLEVVLRQVLRQVPMQVVPLEVVLLEVVL